MQLVPCSHCKRHVSVVEAACPFCAAPLGKATPRNAHLVGRIGRAAVFAGATLVGCSTTPEPQKPPPPPPDEVVRQDPPPPPPPPDPVDPVPADAGVTFAQPPTTTATIMGTVTQANSKSPIYGVQIYAKVGSTVTARTTDGNGNYRFDNLVAGTYTLSFQQSSNHPRQAPPPPITRVVQVTDGATKRVDVALQVIPVPVDRGPCCKPYGAPPARRRMI